MFRYNGREDGRTGSTAGAIVRRGMSSSQSSMPLVMNKVWQGTSLELRLMTSILDPPLHRRTYVSTDVMILLAVVMVVATAALVL